MPPSSRYTIDLMLLLEHVAAHGTGDLSRVERAILSGMIEGYVQTYQRWHRAVWR